MFALVSAVVVSIQSQYCNVVVAALIGRARTELGQRDWVARLLTRTIAADPAEASGWQNKRSDKDAGYSRVA